MWSFCKNYANNARNAINEAGVMNHSTNITDHTPFQGVTVSNTPFQITTPGVLISEETRLILQWLFYAVLLMIVDVFGTVTNIINIICFAKQGFKDPVNVSLLGLAISDLGCVVTLLWSSICFNPAFHALDLPFDSVDISYLTGGWPHVIFTRVSSWITALITLERCLCITMPLKVKSIFTPKRVAFIIACIFVIPICSVSPIYYVNRFGMVYYPKRNKTILGLVHTDDRAIVEEYSFAFNSLLIPFGAFMTIIICTTVLVIKLRSQAEWRLKCTGPIKAEATTSDRDQRVTKMVVMISALFIACFIPLCFTFIAMIIEPELSINGRYKNTLYVLGGVSFVIESANSATNIFIYYHMSSRYRVVYRHLFCFKRDSNE